jgi:hypothetical protein
VRRGLLRRWQTRTGTIILVVCLSLVLCLRVRVWCIPFLLKVGVSFLHKVCLLTEIVVGVLGLGVVSLLDIPSLVANTIINQLAKQIQSQPQDTDLCGNSYGSKTRIHEGNLHYLRQLEVYKFNGFTRSGNSTQVE